MKIKALSVLVCLVAGTVCYAGSAHMGTWKLNDGKSKIAPGATKNHSVIYEAAGDDIKITVDGTGADGQPVHHEWTGKFDGKEYPVTGDPASDARSYVKIDEHTLEFTAKKAGKVTTTARVETTADGKVRTVRTTATDANGKKVKSTAVYDKQ